jgi:hypothetical protein
MGGAWRHAWAFALLIAVAFTAGCGGGDSTQGPSAGAHEAKTPSVSGPSSEFIVPGGDNIVQLFGREATVAERGEASATIQAWMRARVAGEWAKECRYLHRAVVESALHAASNLASRKLDRCPVALAVLAAKGLSGSRTYTMTGPIDSLRIGEGHGYAQYHGRAGRDWIVPVRREDGDWKVSGLEPLDRLK